MQLLDELRNSVINSVSECFPDVHFLCEDKGHYIEFTAFDESRELWIKMDSPRKISFCYAISNSDNFLTTYSSIGECINGLLHRVAVKRVNHYMKEEYDKVA